jgi:hypothetical protein
LRGGVDRDGGDAGAGEVGGEEEAVGGGSELGEEAGGGVWGVGDDIGDEGVEGGVAGAGGVAGDVGVVAGVGGDGGWSGVAVLTGQVRCVDERGAGRVEAFDEAVLQTAGGGGLDDGGGRDGEGGTEDAAGEEDGVGSGGDARDGEAAAACVGDEDWIQVLIELADEGVGRAAGRAGEGCSGGRCDGAGGCGAGDVDVACRVDGHGEADVSLCAELGLREKVGRGGVCLEEADAIFLVEEEVEIASGVGLDGVELGIELRVWIG